MEKTKQMEEKIVADIIRRYGDVINLKENPALIVEIIRNFGKHLFDDGGLPGGVGPVPPPPSPTSHFDTVTNAELMKQLLKLTKDLAIIQKKLG